MWDRRNSDPVEAHYMDPPPERSGGGSSRWSLYPHSNVDFSLPKHGLPIPSFKELTWRPVSIELMSDGMANGRNSVPGQKVSRMQHHASMRVDSTQEYDMRTMVDTLPVWTPRSESAALRTSRSSAFTARSAVSDQPITAAPWQLAKYEEELQAVSVNPKPQTTKPKTQNPKPKTQTQNKKTKNKKPKP